MPVSEEMWSSQVVLGRPLQEESGGYPSPGSQQITRMLDAGTSRLNLTTWPNNPNRLGAHKTIFCRPISIRGLLPSGHNTTKFIMVWTLWGGGACSYTVSHAPNSKGRTTTFPNFSGLTSTLIRRWCIISTSLSSVGARAAGGQNICDPYVHGHTVWPRWMLTRDLFAVAKLLVVNYQERAILTFLRTPGG